MSIESARKLEQTAQEFGEIGAEISEKRKLARRTVVRLARKCRHPLRQRAQRTILCISKPKT
ncbi:hypothetical protein [Geomicrobium sp. JCM 19039]|uniref:hypothetical protein n=1 Tax=Geomicrobium sp. JCM 19039 TaxID=1460636 RepID=UPI00045F3796|nr:hypothetical protein [Geomicrobium sp. JCM 19039]GAK12426.1 hypothetical protein JCM19039_2197 [Geomicrobium sp. JCM 19039]